MYVQFKCVSPFSCPCGVWVRVCVSNNDTHDVRNCMRIFKKTKTLPLRANTRARAQHANEIGKKTNFFQQQEKEGKLQNVMRKTEKCTRKEQKKEKWRNVQI